MTPSLPRGQSAPKVRAPGVILRDLQNHGSPRRNSNLAHLGTRVQKIFTEPAVLQARPPVRGRHPQPHGARGRRWGDRLPAGAISGAAEAAF